MLALFVSFAFILSGCGNQLDAQVKVNVGEKEDYVAVTEETAFNMEEVQVDTTASSIKFTMKASAEELDMGEGSPVAMSFLLNCIIEVPTQEGDELGVALKVSMSMGSESQESTLYIKGGEVFIESMGEKFKMPLDQLLPSGEGSDEAFDTSALEEFFVGIMTDEDLQQKVLVSGTTAKYLFELDGQELYIIVKDGKLSQAYLALTNLNIAEVLALISPEAADGVPPIVMDELSVAVEIGNAKISYPNAKDYVSMEE